MILSHEPNFPSTRRYVLKLHRDAAAAPGRLIGRLENMSTGRHCDFSSGEQLLAWLAADLTAPDFESHPFADIPTYDLSGKS